MDMLRRNVFWIVCGLVAAAGIALAVTGLRAMPAVAAEMEGAAGVYRSLEGLQSQPLNERAIASERERIAGIKEDYDKVIAKARELYKYEPLLPDVFPEGPPLKLIEFRKAYTEAINDLYARLRCGSLPSATMIKTMQERRANELASGMPAIAASDQRTVAGVITSSGLRDDPAARAAIANARSFLCYCTPLGEEKSDYVPSLAFNSGMRESATVEAPEPFDVWVAQVGYWIQKDVVDAIVAVNEQAIQEARAAGQDPWVGTMAVKDIISIRLANQYYVPPEGELFAVAKPGDYAAAVPPGTAESVFTSSRSNQQFDVIQYTVKLVMDQRDIPLLIEKMTNNRFHTLLRASYKAVPANRELKGRIYGPEPAVNVVLDFEIAMLGDLFRPMMPQLVCEHFSIACPPREEAKEEN